MKTKIIILVLISIFIVPTFWIISPQYRSLEKLEHINGICVDCNQIDLKSGVTGGTVNLVTMDNGTVYSIPKRMLKGIKLNDLVGEQLCFYADDAVLWYENRVVAWESNDLIKETGTLKEKNKENLINFFAMLLVYLLFAFLFLLKDLLKLWQKVSIKQDKKWDLIKKEANKKRREEHREKYEAKVQEYETEAKFYHAQKNTSKKKLKKRKNK